VFGCWPDNQISVDSDVEGLRESADKSKYHEMIGEVKGYAVDYPLDF
jgi:hypothetical protein